MFDFGMFVAAVYKLVSETKQHVKCVSQQNKINLRTYERVRKLVKKQWKSQIWFYPCKSEARFQTCPTTKMANAANLQS